MKTGMEVPLIFLAFLLGMVVLWSTWSGYQVDIAAAQVQATVSGGAVTAPAMLGAEMVVKALIGLVFGGCVTAGIAYAVAWVRRQGGRNWKGGPNAKWKKAQDQPQQPRPMSDAELYRFMMAQQMRTGGAANGNNMRVVREEDADEPILRI